MSSKAMKRIGWFFLLVSLTGVFFYVVRLPHHAAIAASETQTMVTFQGGMGDSPGTAVIIRGAVDGFAGVEAEYRYLREKFGQQTRDWRLKRQLLQQKGDRVFDVMHLELADGSQRTIYFDITEFFSKK